jgi:hypothetical protein
MSIRNCLSRYFSSTFIGLIIVPAISLASVDNGTLTVGKSATDLPPPFSIWACFSGYNSTLGSYSPNSLTGGKTVVALEDLDTGGTSACSNVAKNSIVTVSGFSIDPGQAWITSVTCNGIVKTGVSASSFSYSSGTASWTWNGSDFGLISKSSGANVSCSISHS